MDEITNHIVLISGGLASFEAARRIVGRYGKENVHLWFFDTLIEDEDLYRFLHDTEEYLQIKITRFVDGRTPWQVFRDEKYIGNSRVDLCSKHLKRLFLERVLRKNYSDKRSICLYFGIDWSEEHRINLIRPKWIQKGYKVDFPLIWDPWLSYSDYKRIIEDLGIRIPRLYEWGFPHNNCGGGCVKAGIHQWSLLYKKLPERFSWHEEQERELRKLLKKDISILRSRRNGITKPFTLEALRNRLDSHVNSDATIFNDIVDDSSCSCFVNPND